MKIPWCAGKTAWAVLISSGLCFADGPPPITRPPEPVEPAEHAPRLWSDDQPLKIHRVKDRAPRAAPDSGITTGRVCILVHTNLYNALSSDLTTYRADLSARGFSSFIDIYESGTPEDIRNLFSNYYYEAASLNGAVLIGDLPYIEYEMSQTFPGWPTEYEDFPCDLFYMDLNGGWHDYTNSGSFQTGVYDSRSGDLDLEIWTCRLRTDTLPSLGGETVLLTNYFARNHAYQNRETNYPASALIYNDDDWISGSHGDIEDDSNSLVRLFGEINMEILGAADETTRDDFENNRLTGNYDFMHVRSHGYATMHCFYENSGANWYWTYSSDYRSIDPRMQFYSMYICEAGNFTTNEYLGGTAVFNPEGRGLAAWTSTKRGGIWHDLLLYRRLARGECLGEAFRVWFNDAQSDWTVDEWAQEYWYGMVILGDASLCLREPVTRYVSHDGSATYPYTNWTMAATGVSQAVYAALEADTVRVTNGVYQAVNISIRGAEGRHITLESENGAHVTVLEGGYPERTNTCLTIDNAQATVRGFTVTGGAQLGPWPNNDGGGILLEGDVLIADCVIVSNCALYGGGIYSDEGTIRNCHIRHNRAVNTNGSGGLGGGIYSWGDSIISNSIIADNTADRWGGGLIARYRDVIDDCFIIDNSAVERGGGIYFMNNEKAWLRQSIISSNTCGGEGGGIYIAMTNWCIGCLIAENTSPTGGGVYAAKGPFLINCTIVSNQGATGGGAYVTNGVTAMNTIIAHNSASNLTEVGTTGTYTYCCIEPAPAGEGNISGIPGLVFHGAYPYQLNPCSICRDAGTNLFWTGLSNDLRDLDRIINSVIDIGAYECRPPDWDEDSDTLTDVWEWRYSRTFTNMCPTNDVDNDTFDNKAEYIAGTDPTNIMDYFKTDDVWLDDPSICCLRWTGRADRVYDVLYTTNLPAGAWQSFPGATNLTGEGIMIFTNIFQDDPCRFYRIEVTYPTP